MLLRLNKKIVSNFTKTKIQGGGTQTCGPSCYTSCMAGTSAPGGCNKTNDMICYTSINAATCN